MESSCKGKMLSDLIAEVRRLENKELLEGNGIETSK